MKPDPQKLKAAREKHGWSQPYAAGLLGINWRTLLRWERGQSVKSPTAADLQAMASVYGVGVAELCEVGNGNRKPCPYCHGAGGFDDTDLECLDCDGTGFEPTCAPCNGKGWLRCDRCIGNYCERCERTEGMVRCHLCDGSGHSLEVPQ